LTGRSAGLVLRIKTSVSGMGVAAPREVSFVGVAGD
jgi:hypothetical protein